MLSFRKKAKYPKDFAHLYLYFWVALRFFVILSDSEISQRIIQDFK